MDLWPWPSPPPSSSSLEMCKANCLTIFTEEDMHDYFSREKRENLVSEGVVIEMPERTPLSPEAKSK